MADSERKAVPGNAEDTTLEQMGYHQGKLISFGLNHQKVCAMSQIQPRAVLALKVFILRVLWQGTLELSS